MPLKTYYPPNATCRGLSQARTQAWGTEMLLSWATQYVSPLPPSQLQIRFLSLPPSKEPPSLIRSTLEREREGIWEKLTTQESGMRNGKWENSLPLLFSH